MRRALCLFTILVPAVLFLPAVTPVSAESAFEKYFSGSHINFELSDDVVTDTTKFEAELELRYRDDRISAFIRGSNDRPFGYQTESFEITKRGFNYELNDDWEITLGDYSLVMARGLALNATEDRPVDHDAQLDGAMIEGEFGSIDLTGFWGKHKSDNLDYYVSGVNTDPDGNGDELYGTRLEFDFDDFDLGASWIDAELSRFGDDQSVVITEFDASWRVENVTLYYESAWFNREEPEWAEESYDGRGQLAEIMYSVPGFSTVGGWVRYDDANFDYAVPPSLKRPEVDDSTANPYDETGWRLDTRISPDSWSGHSVRLLYTDLEGIHNKDAQFENLFFEWSSPATAEWTTSFSYDKIDGRLLYYGGLDGQDENFRVTVDGPCPLGGSMHFSGRYRNLSNEFENDDELGLGFDWSINPDFTIGFFRETSTREIEPPPPGFYDIPADSPGQWNSMFIRYTPDPWSEFELLVGSQRGGFHCSGGVCAQLPPFKGVRFTFYRVF